jgi:hypothetical protein
MKNQLESLLSQISVIIEEEKKLKQRQYDSGEAFNVFEVLKLQRNEVRLHSSFIATLLNPKGPHGLSSKPLDCFLRTMEAEDILHDLATVNVETEKNIGTISKNGEVGGRMDIVLTDKYNNAIVIENKIDAKDQPKQLLRYDNYCKKNYNKYRIYYLTKWGEKASDSSCGGKSIDYWTASYNDDVLSWLDKCVELSSMASPVNETIKQYRTNLVEILNIMSQKSEKELLSVTTDDKNIESTLAILENQEIIGRKIRFDFLRKLLAVSKKYNFTGDIEEAEALADLQKDSYLRLISPSRSSHYGIFIGNDKPSDGFWYSIESYDKSRITRTNLLQLNQQWGLYDRKKQKIDYPYGWDFFWSENGEKDSGRWWDWRDVETLRAMYNGSLLEFIEKNILKTTVEQHLLEDLENAIK